MNITMKKLLTLASMAVLSVSAYANSPRTISMIYPYGAGDPPANYTRFAIEEMNKTQNRYRFIFENRPGAGSAIASKHVEANGSNTILSTATAFFVRPNFFPNESHSVSNFVPLTVKCANPAVVVSKKHRSFDALNKSAFTIGTSGLGDTTYLLAMQIKERYPNATIVPYKSTTEALAAVVGDQIDFSIGFVAAAEQFIDRGDMRAVGISGKKSIKGIPLLSAQGIPYADEIVIAFFTVVNKDLPADVRRDFREITVNAERAPAVQDAYRSQYCDPITLNEAQTQEWFDRQIFLWNKLTKTVKLDK